MRYSDHALRMDQWRHHRRFGWGLANLALVAMWRTPRFALRAARFLWRIRMLWGTLARRVICMPTPTAAYLRRRTCETHTIYGATRGRLLLLTAETQRRPLGHARPRHPAQRPPAASSRTTLPADERGGALRATAGL
jgi:hypothetical protein